MVALDALGKAAIMKVQLLLSSPLSTSESTPVVTQTLPGEGTGMFF